LVIGVDTQGDDHVLAVVAAAAGAVAATNKRCASQFAPAPVCVSGG
jgi:hypothetical protein